MGIHSTTRLHIPKTDYQQFSELVVEMLEDDKWVEYRPRLEEILHSFIDEGLKAEILVIYYSISDH